MIVPAMEQAPTLDPGDLLVFAHIVDAGSFTRAAEQLGLPKSTVSRRLAQLEERLGERLLLRTTRKLTLTDFGQGILGHARQIAAEVDAARAIAENRKARPTGRLRVSLPGDFANIIAQHVLAPYIERYPDVVLELDLSPRRIDLIGENFDLALRFGDLPDDATLVARPIGEFRQGLFASPDYLIRHGHPSSPEDLAGHHTLGLSARDGQTRPWRLENGTQRIDFPPRPRVTANSPELLLELASASSGIALAPMYYAVEAVAAGRLKRILPAWSATGDRAWAVFPERRLMPERTRAFLELLQELPIRNVL